MKIFFKVTLLLFFILSMIHVNAQDECEMKVKDYIMRTKFLLAGFISYPDTDEKRNAYLNAVDNQNPGFLKKLVLLVQEAEEKRVKDSQWLQCYTAEFANINPTPADGNISSWYSYLGQTYVANDFISPEFRKGSGIHIDFSQGVANPGKDSESYSMAARVLYSYTPGRNGHNSGGRWRGMIGASAYYRKTDFLVFLNPRVEFKVKDIGNAQTSIGNIKLIADANFGEGNVIGGGVGLEIYNFGIQLLYQRQSREERTLLLTGLFYRFQF